MSRISSTVVILAAALTAGGCRDDVSPFQTEDRPPRGSAAARQLTFSPGDDRAPVWSATGDSIYYSAEGFDPLPAAPGVLVGLPVNGRGTAAPILRNVQVPGGEDEDVWLTTPQLAPGGDRLAFVQIVSLSTPLPCDPDQLNVFTSCSPVDPASFELPPLRQIALRVRAPSATGPLATDPALEVDIPGVTVTPGTPTEYVINDHPFQQAFEEELAFVFRPSWSPDGRQLVFSNGLGLFIWSVGAEDAQPIPNTADAAWPAWSPDGDWIAFTRLERADSTGSFCTFSAMFGPFCTQERTEYVPGRRVLSLVRPDGSELTEVGDGGEPAWSPSGSTIFFRRDAAIWRIDRDGTNAAKLPNTADGREPAVAPDGRFLAFARLSTRGTHDIWVIELQP